MRIADNELLTVAAFMERALYDGETGYYARAAQRSGRAGDFFTSVDVGPLFGELLASQLAEMSELLGQSPVSSRQSPVSSPQSPVSSRQSPVSSPQSPVSGPQPPAPSPEFDLVEAGAGNGRLSADILLAARTQFPDFFARTRLHLVEASGAARAAQRATLGDAAGRLASSAPSLPDSFEGVLLANELLDAMPVHQVVMRDDGLREVYVKEDGRGGLTTIEGPPSAPALAAYLDRAGAMLEPGWRAEINLRAVDWVADAARRLRRGFLIFIDYGHDARELYSATHAGGTLTSFTRHTSAGPEAGGVPGWLQSPGEQDITAHVDFTSVRAAAEAEGCVTLGFLDQTYFLLGILAGGREPFAVSAKRAVDTAKGSRPLKTLLMPGGLGSTHKVLILGKGVGSPPLSGLSFRVRVT